MLTLSGVQIPQQLRAIPDPPVSIYVRGTLPAGPERSIAIVGSRRITPYGRAVTERLARELASAGVVVVSGLALGVDAAAHGASLNAGGVTVAVLPGGIDRVYPRSHEPLARQIINSGGCLVSEHAGTYSPRQHDFLIRNRLIAGLADAVLVTEAAERSGSLNTARHALEQGKTVFAVPGNITSDTSGGTNNLIKAGAVPVTRYEDIFHAMGWEVGAPQDHYAANDQEARIISLLKEGVTSADELLVRSGLTAASFTEAMTMLEIAAVIRPLGANQWALS